MSKKIHLQIPEPCHEGWDKMLPAEKGRFCNSCQKTVVDFTGMSDPEVLAFFRKPITGSVCGRFMSDQLNKDLMMPQKRLPWLKYFFQFLIPVFLTSLKATSQGGVVIKEKKEKITCAKPQREVFQTLGMIAPDYLQKFNADQKMIEGRVIDEKGKPVQYASIMLKGTTMGTVAGADGKFKITVPNSKNPQILVCSSVGYVTSEQQIDLSLNSTHILIMKLYSALNGEIVIVGITVRKKPEKVPVFNRTLLDTAFNNFKVFPNPVQSGSGLNIELKKSPAGEYLVELNNQQGQLVHQEVARFQGRKERFPLNIPFLTPGVYFIRLTNKESGKKHTEKIIIR